MSAPLVRPRRGRTLILQAGTPVPDLGVNRQWQETIKRRDGDAAAAMVRTSLAEVHNRALRIFSRWPSVAASEITAPHP
ncbi:hypothetical protein ACWEPC_45350 [Nonomuraea sp. NPDC004297]